MRETQITTKQNMTIGLPKDQSGEKRFLIGGMLILVFSLLVVGACYAPEVTVFGIVGVGLGIPLLLLVWYRPEFGLLGLIFLTSSFVPADVVDVRLPIGGGLDLRDLVLIGLFGLLFLRELSRGTLRIQWWRVSGPLVLFLILALFSSFYAIVLRNVESNWALNDMRILSSYIIFFIVIWSIKRVHQLQTLMLGLFIIADLTTAIVILQQIVGADNPLLQSMMTTRDWRVYQEEGGVRVIPAGQLLMHFMWFIALGRLIFTDLEQHKRTFFIFQLLFIGAGHILTYMRSQWAAMAIGVCLIVLVLVPKYRANIPKYFFLGLSVILIIALLWGTIGLSDLLNIPFVTGVVDRFVSILTLDDTLETNSLQWRRFENGKALEAIQKQPLTGVGLGGRYREVTTFQGEAAGLWTRGSVAAGAVSRFTRYVHNSYLSIGVKMGIPGLIVILWFFTAFLVNGWKIYQNLTDLPSKGIVLGVIASFAGLLAWSFFHAHLIKAESTPVIGLMTGLVALIDSLYNKGRLPSTAPGYLLKG